MSKFVKIDSTCFKAPESDSCWHWTLSEHDGFWRALQFTPATLERHEPALDLSNPPKGNARPLRAPDMPKVMIKTSDYSLEQCIENVLGFIGADCWGVHPRTETDHEIVTTYFDSRAICYLADEDPERYKVVKAEVFAVREKMDVSAIVRDLPVGIELVITMGGFDFIDVVVRRVGERFVLVSVYYR